MSNKHHQGTPADAPSVLTTIPQPEGPTDLAVVDNLLESMFADAGTGAAENATLADVTIPRMILLQASSDELKRGHRKYIPGAIAGNLVNSLTLEEFDGEQGIAVIPVHYERVVRQWFNKRAVATHPSDTPLLNKAHADAKGKGKWITVDGIAGKEEHELVETAEFYVLHLREDNRAYRMLLSMKKTQLKVAKRLVSLIKDCQIQHGNKFFNPPSFAQVYRLTVVPETNQEDQQFNNFAVAFVTTVKTAGLYAEAKSYYEEAKAGAVKVADEGVADDNTSDKSTEEEQSPFDGSNSDDKIPF